VGWDKPQDYELQQKVSVASIGATGALPESSRWLTLALPAVPHHLSLPEYPFGAYASSAGVRVLVKESAAAWAFVGLDLTAGEVHSLPGAAKLPSLDPCVPSGDGRRALCVASKVTPRVPECKARTTRLDASFVGASGSAPTGSPGAAPVRTAGQYFASGGASIPDPLAPSKEEAAERRSQLWCGEPGWDRLRKAIENYCVDLRHQRDASRKKSQAAALAETLSAYCSDQPDSLLYQAQNCTDQPPACEHAALSNVLLVDRNEFEHGTDRLVMDVFNDTCQVWFQESHGEAGAWRLVDHECNGD